MVERITKAKSYLGHDSWQGWYKRFSIMASAMAHNTLSVVSILSEQLTAVFVDDYGKIIEYLFETAQKRPQTTSNREVSPLLRPAFICE